MTQYDLLVRHGTLVTAAGEQPIDLAAADGRIVALGLDLAGTGKEEIDATGLHIFPGIIDSHVHFNEPGRSAWEGIATGSAALAAGGATTFFDMPLNASPPTLDAASFDLKLQAAQNSSFVDFAFWGGLVPGNLAHLDELFERGVVGFKAFMSNSGIEDFAAVDDLTLYEGMERIASLGSIIAVHAENDQITGALARRALAQGRTGVRDYLASRPVIAELEAIARTIEFAADTGCALHIVHVSSGRGVGLVLEARARGVNVSCETCPHYLVLSEEDVERLGAIAKCAPPIRSRAEQDALWQHIFSDNLPMVVSDHSPAPAEMKSDENFFKVWGGISGCQSVLQLLLTEGYERRRLPLSRIVTLTSENIARRFGLLPSKGQLAIGADADMTLVDLRGRQQLEAGDLQYRHKHSPYVGMSLRGRIVRTLLHGRTIFREGKIVSPPAGQFVKPSQPPTLGAAKPRQEYRMRISKGELYNMSMLRITAGPFTFMARMEEADAPKTCEAFSRILPFRSKIIHARWSGEAAWIPLGDFQPGVSYENHTSYPAPGQILFYPGGYSETEILFPYGATHFASKLGQLAGNHFLTIVDGTEQLRELGRLVLWEGAQDIVFEKV
jgi:allantoinase